MAKEIQLKQNDTLVYPQLELKEHTIQFVDGYSGKYVCYSLNGLCFFSCEIVSVNPISNSWTNVILLPSEIFAPKMDIFLFTNSVGQNIDIGAVLYYNKISIRAYTTYGTGNTVRLFGFWKIG